MCGPCAAGKHVRQPRMLARTCSLLATSRNPDRPHMVTVSAMAAGADQPRTVQRPRPKRTRAASAAKARIQALVDMTGRSEM